MVTEAAQALDRLDRWLVMRDVTGWDPYDGLASPAARLVRGRRPRQAVVQAVKRSPEAVRRALGVPQHRMTKALALLSESLRTSAWLPRAPERREQHLREIVERRGVDAWGYEFDVQTRWGFYPAGSPNAIVTAFACEAVADVLPASDTESVVAWLTGPMWTGRHFRYVPGNDTLVHNANVLAARALHRLSPGHPLVAGALSVTLEALPKGGLWPYGATAELRWVDNFHTAYVLESLLDLTPEGGPEQPALELAVGEYLRSCFTPDGRPHYYAGGGGPVDVHNVATALKLLIRLHGRGLAPRALLTGCTAHALSLQRTDGAFTPRASAVPFVRWNQAHMHLALSALSA